MELTSSTLIDKLMPELSTLFDTIRDQSRDGAGVTRDAFGPRETQAAETLAAFARRKNLQACSDAAGNLHVMAGGALDDPPRIMLGSHLDSVPVGGNYDGLAGVIAGLAVLCLLDRGMAAKAGVRVVGFRGEESPWFSQAYLGSKLLLGEFAREDLDSLRRYDTGKTLAEHVRSIGGSVGSAKLRPTINLSKLKAYYELHIEQAPLLENLDLAVGIATAIRGNIRYPFASCRGHYAHSGAVPRRFRHDALVASAKLIAFADQHWQELIDCGNDDLVFTCGIFHTDGAEHAMTKVPGLVNFTLNIGGTKNAVMQALHDAIAARANELAREHDVVFELGRRVGTPAIDLDESLIGGLERACGEVGLNSVRMPTVGHDAAMFQRRGIPAAVVLVRNANGSHNPAEHMEMSDFAAGTKVLAAHILGRCQEEQ
jgi:beta-ureidopropionase / N-carbamoyl-L-amino-acid hydrolase